MVKNPCTVPNLGIWTNETKWTNLNIFPSCAFGSTIALDEFTGHYNKDQASSPPSTIENIKLAEETTFPPTLHSTFAVANLFPRTLSSTASIMS